MGAVAAMLRDEGYTVTGSDESVYPPMSTFLADKDIAIQAGYKPENLPTEDAILVVGNTIKRGNPELEAAMEAKRLYLSLPETMKTYFLRKTHNLVVTGTHGKTTTTSLLAWIFEHAGKKPSYLIGGLPRKTCPRAAPSNPALTGSLRATSTTPRFSTSGASSSTTCPSWSSSTISSSIMPISSTTSPRSKNRSRTWCELCRATAWYWSTADDANALAVVKDSPAAHPPKSVFPKTPPCGSPMCASKVSIRSSPLLKTEFTLAMSGTFNVRNAAMAIAAAHFYQIPLPEIVKAVASFEGVRRRQEIRGEVRGVTIIDDFGHHPTAMRETLQGLRHRFPHTGDSGHCSSHAAIRPGAPFFNTIFRLPWLSPTASSWRKSRRWEQIPVNERLHPEQVVADINAAGVPAYYEPDANAIVAKLNPLLNRAMLWSSLVMAASAEFTRSSWLCRRSTHSTHCYWQFTITIL